MESGWTVRQEVPLPCSHVLLKVTLYLSYCCQRSCQHKIHDKLNPCSIISTCDESARKNKLSSLTWPPMLSQLAELWCVAWATAVLTGPTQQSHRSRNRVTVHSCISKHSIGALATELASYIVCVVFLHFQTLPVWAIPESVLKAKAQTSAAANYWVKVLINLQCCERTNKNWAEGETVDERNNKECCWSDCVDWWAVAVPVVSPLH